MAPKVVDKAEKQQEILAAALLVFTERGFHEINMADIAKAADIGKGTIYEYFSSKDELLYQAFLTLMTGYELMLQQIAASESPPVEAIVEALVGACHDAKEYDNLIPTLFQMVIREVYNTNSQVKQELERFVGQIEAILSPIIERGQATGEIDPAADPGVMARTLFAAIDGIQLSYTIFKPGDEFFDKQTQIVEQMIRRTLQGHKIQG